MRMIQIHASPNDLHKLSKRVASFRQPGFIWRQVARNNVRKIWPSYMKMVAATQVRRRINLCRLAKVGVSAPREFIGSTDAVQAIAVGHCAHNIAAESHQG